MAAPTVNFAITRPTRANGAPFTPSVYNADRVAYIEADAPDLLPDTGGIVDALEISGALNHTGALTVAGAIVATSAPLTSTSVASLELTAAGSPLPGGIRPGAAGSPLLVVWHGTATAQVRRGIHDPGGPLVQPVFFQLKVPLVFSAADLAKMVVQLTKRTADFIEPLASYQLDAFNATQSVVYVETEPTATADFGDPDAIIHLTADILILRHTA